MNECCQRLLVVAITILMLWTSTVQAYYTQQDWDGDEGYSLCMTYSHVLSFWKVSPSTKTSVF
jgi:hypothetical protein